MKKLFGLGDKKSSLRLKKKLNISISILLVVVIVATLAANIIINITRYTPEFYRIPSKNIANKVRLVFLSDLHLREYGEGNEILIRDIENLAPDLILLGGDLVTESKPDYSNMTDLCEKLTKIAPVFGVWGNHEDVKMYVQKDTKLRESFESTGAVFLTNESKTVRIKGNTVAVCGLDGSAANFEKYGALEAANSFDKLTADFKILLAHVPTYFTECLDGYNFDLGIAGHTHGGIVNIPKLGALYSAEEGFFPKYASGQHTLKGGAQLIISRGLGHSSAIPRINNIPELSVIDVD